MFYLIAYALQAANYKPVMKSLLIIYARDQVGLW